MQTLLSLFGAIVLLLWGMNMVRKGITQAFGHDLKVAIGMSVANRFSALLVGAGVTTLLQSSTATGLMVASFSARGLISTAPALAVMLGADVGTTLVAQVLTFDASWISPFLMILGHLLRKHGKAFVVQSSGYALFGLGLMLLSLKILVELSAFLNESSLLVHLIGALESEIGLGIILAALLTWLLHSSLAVVLLIVSMVSNQVLPLELAFSMILGANLGSALPPIMATLNDAPIARRVPIGNGLFKLSGVLVVSPFLAYLPELMRYIDSSESRQLVHFHMMFNIAIALFFIGLIHPVADFMSTILGSNSKQTASDDTRHLDSDYIGDPKTALAAALRETMRMGDVVDKMLLLTRDAIVNNDLKTAERIGALDNNIDELHEKIRHFLSAVSRTELDKFESKRVTEILVFSTKLEHIGDLTESMATVLATKANQNRHFSSGGEQELLSIHKHVHRRLKLMLGTFITNDQVMAEQIYHERKQINEMEEEGVREHIRRIKAGKIESLETSAYHMDLIRDLCYIDAQILSVVKPMLLSFEEKKPLEGVV